MRGLMSIRYIGILLFAFLMPFGIKANPHYSYKNIGSNEGLSSSYVKAIAQDSNGFIWFGTKNGLDRYDGISLHSFYCRDQKASRGNNNIGAIYESRDKKLWIGTDRGVYVFDPISETFKVLDKQSRTGVKAEDWVQTIDEDNSGNVWVLIPNQGVFRINNSGMEFYNVTAHNGDKEKLPVSMIVTERGNIFVGTSRQGLYFYDPQTNSFRKFGGSDPAYDHLDSIVIQYLAEREDGTIFAATRHGEILSIDPTTSRINNIPFSKTGQVIVHSFANIDNELWLGTNEGIFTISGSGESEISKGTMGRRSLSDNTITSIVKDRDDNVWVGTMFGGANFIQRSGLIFEKYGSDITQRGLTSNHIRGIAIDATGKVWVGTEESGLNILEPATGSVTRLNSKDPTNKVTLCVKSIGDKIYAGYAQGGCAIMQNGSRIGTLDINLSPSPNDVYNVFEDRQGNMWVAASWGLFRKNKNESDYRLVDDVGYSWIYDIFQDSKGKIWIASMGEGIWSYDPKSDKYHHYIYDEAHSNGLCSNSISSIMQDSKGRLWFSTDRGGLALYNPKSDNFISYGLSAGFPDDTVYDVLEDGLGNLWFGTNRGLVKFNPDNKSIKLFSKGNNQFNYHSAAKGADGRFYMGALTGCWFSILKLIRI